jgi:hypothetical protein
MEVSFRAMVGAAPLAVEMGFCLPMPSQGGSIANVKAHALALPSGIFVPPGCRFNYYGGVSYLALLHWWKCHFRAKGGAVSALFVGSA